MYEDLQESNRMREVLRKRLTSKDDKYDEVWVPKLNIKQLQASLKMADKFTLNQVVELLKIDYVDMVVLLWNSLWKDNWKEISIASNAIRGRIQGWIDVLWGYTKDDSFIDRAKGTVEQVKKK